MDGQNETLSWLNKTGSQILSNSSLTPQDRDIHANKIRQINISWSKVRNQLHSTQSQQNLSFYPSTLIFFGMLPSCFHIYTAVFLVQFNDPKWDTDNRALQCCWHIFVGQPESSITLFPTTKSWDFYISNEPLVYVIKRENILSLCSPQKFFQSFNQKAIQKLTDEMTVEAEVLICNTFLGFDLQKYINPAAFPQLRYFTQFSLKIYCHSEADTLLVIEQAGAVVG